MNDKLKGHPNYIRYKAVAPRGGKGLALGFPLYVPGAPESHHKETMLAKTLSLLRRTKPNQIAAPKPLLYKNSGANAPKYSLI